MTPNDKYGLISLPYILAYKSRNIKQILANFFFQFDLYAGQRIFVSNPLFNGYMHVIRQYKGIDEIFKKSILDSFFDLFFEFDLYVG